MATLNIEGQRVQVDDSFLKLPPAQQHATVDQIAKRLSIHIRPVGADKTPSMAEGMVRAAGTGVPIVGGLLNKADAATDAALAPIVDPLLPDSMQKLPEKTFGGRYHHALDIQQGKDKSFETEHPIADAVAEIAGGLASTGAAASTGAGAKLLGLTGKTLPQMIGRGALSGAAINGTDAAVRGDNPLTAAAIGGAVGAVAPAVGRLATAASGRIASTARAIRDPAGEASRRAAIALDHDIRVGDQGLNAQEFFDAKRGGDPVALADIGGEATRALARSAANTSPGARTELNGLIDSRFESQAPRMAQWLQRTFHYPNADAQHEALDKVARTVNRPGYAKAYSEGANLPFDENLEQISQAPVVQDAIRKAMVSAKNDAARAGFTPPKNPFTSDSNGRIKLRTNADGSVMRPSLQFWDIVKRNLDRIGTRESKDWARVLREHLDTLVPSYGKARAGAASFFGAGNALEAGQDFVGASQRFGINATRKALAKMSPDERQLFQDGYVSRLIQTIEKTPDRQSVVNRIANSPAAKEEINVALGRDRANEFMARMHVEDIMDLARKAVQGNSTTARQLVELGIAGGVGGYESWKGDPQALMKAALVYGAMRGQGVIDERVASEVAKLLVSDDIGKLAKGMRILAKNKNLTAAIKNADAALASIGARAATPSVSRRLGTQ